MFCVYNYSLIIFVEEKLFQYIVVLEKTLKYLKLNISAHSLIDNS